MQISCDAKLLYYMLLNYTALIEPTKQGFGWQYRMEDNLILTRRRQGYVDKYRASGLSSNPYFYPSYPSFSFINISILPSFCSAIPYPAFSSFIYPNLILIYFILYLILCLIYPILILFLILSIHAMHPYILNLYLILILSLFYLFILILYLILIYSFLSFILSFALCTFTFHFYLFTFYL